MSSFDQQIMQRCLELAKQAAGQTAPNPMVGAVVVQAGQIVGEGFHPAAGQPHAEVFALRDAAAQARGATVYVNLEPCSHYGRTPPCADALIQAGVARVVVGMVDPNPQVAGAGIARLRAAGIEVSLGIEAAACRKLNEGFIHRMLYQKPLGILKYAMTLDGKIAASSGHSAWVTSPEARGWVHRLRAECDAVIVGGNTVRRDNPLLTSHGQGHNPLRVVMSRRLDLPTQAQLWQSDAPTLVLSEAEADPAVRQSLEQQDVEVVSLPVLTPALAMQQLYERGCLSALWECGGTLAASAIADGSVQKILAFVAPKIIGGLAASPVGELGLTKMTEALTLEQLRWEPVGADLLIEAYLPQLIP
ncbi:MAG: bifunctional diaminohydroxyphosphoribosylaminopyrimidine deaminase/5-amino-6-(5-phosphoribosylamino)uracil reductase RibD [Pegethrix bostrychoides GSE-TBD4-15B]|jgi:diaminohydroxyphosphoribosylaminopyrimidine deaminase/5-amino-6-(5-phosphoribosylamino)uracil reductase|uniref:Riboflavin biosynthesis protein RibD n=1 Tax=Pegethrix bostrychoides GSE-TBD4-15B TaxID=2839662 RepID=A0A951U6E3_9CYAN|nr:bifunctional diaminohydroxyphosphoribosylaminopyrimidine deaminase/5-amino-6-(5-phosphoribosylamino)uracil reductase RibD [Pegethrix bostrychoides GSE-TBD4-15B]